MRIAVLNNLRAGRSNAKVSRILSLLRSYPDVFHVETDSAHALPEVLAEIARQNVNLLVVNGVFDRASLGTVNGDIVFHARLLDDGRLEVETVNGDVDIEFAGDVSARFDIETFNGDIRNCFGPKAVRVSEYGPGYELSFTEGDGSGRVTIETLNGDLRLCK